MSLDFLRHLREESRRFRDVLTHADPSQAVPSCPEWTAADLLWHLTHVQGFWARIVERRATSPQGVPEPARPDSYPYLLTEFDAASSRLLEALETTPPSTAAWTWSADQSVGFILRRQAHEALIHRLDAELTVGKVTALPPLLAADGVLEALDVMYGGCPPWGRFTPDGHTITVSSTDTGHVVGVELGRFRGVDPESGVDHDEDDLAVTEPSDDPLVRVKGTADDLDAWLWHRRPGAAVSISGDESTIARLLLILEQPIN